MKIAFLFLVLTMTTVFGGEIANQLPKHPKNHIFPANYDPFRSTNYGITRIGIEHTGCLGTCPIFTFIINSDGTFRYHGEDYAKRRGDWHGTVDLGRLNPVLRYISEMRFFNLDDEYLMPWTDLPGTYTMVVTRTHKKIVYNYAGFGPAKLAALEDIIDRLLEDAKWKRHYYSGKETGGNQAA